MFPFFQDIFSDQEGVAATEFALLVPVLAILLLGIVDYGTYINTRMQMEDLARSAVQYVVQGGDIDRVEDDVIQSSPLFEAGDGGLNVMMQEECECAGGESISCAPGPQCPPTDYKRRFFAVEIDSTYDSLFPWPGLPDNLTIRGYARVQIP